ncbi:RicAFT regulatory complex protein RicA family protein [Staphylococcus warneri]
MYNKKQILSNADQLAQKIKNLEMIKEYQSIESQIHNNKAIENKMNQLKKQQKQSVNLQNYGKETAFHQSEYQIHQLENEINELPIVEEFRASQYEANDLLQMMIKTMENRLNEHNENYHDK